MSRGFKILKYHNLILYGITFCNLLKGSFQGSKEDNWQRPMREVRRTVVWEWRQLWLKMPDGSFWCQAIWWSPLFNSVWVSLIQLKNWMENSSPVLDLLIINEEVRITEKKNMMGKKSLVNISSWAILGATTCSSPFQVPRFLSQ